jgi:predicted DNA binding CopG/RHH family protein
MKTAGKKESGLVQLETPKFRSEAEEARWWYAHRDLVEDLVAANSGREVVVDLAPAKPISIRLPEADIALARKIAAQNGLRYQTYLKLLVHRGLGEDARRKRIA